jgi:hypothetical protein
MRGILCRVCVVKKRRTSVKVVFRKKSDSIYSKIIRLWTWGPFSHTELVFSDGRTFSSDERDGGTRWTTRSLDRDEWDILEVPCSAEDEQRVAAFCHSEENCRYDMVGIGFSFLPVPIGWQSSTKWFCSEICVAALQQIGFLVGYTPSRISPNQLYKLLKKELGQ